MAQLLAMVNLEHTTGVPADRFVNTFAFVGGPGGTVPGAGMIDEVHSALQQFYAAISNYIPSSLVNESQSQIKYYDIAAPKPRVPLDTRSFPGTLGSGNVAGVEEACICISYQAHITSGMNPRRCKGRVYIGPLISGTSQIATDGRARPSSTVIADLALAATGLAASRPNSQWAVWSRMDGTLRPIERGWVDNAFDIQRRRGAPPNSRTLWNP